MGLPLFLLLLAWGLIGVVYQVPAVPVYCLSERSNNKLLDWSESGKPGAYLHVALMWHPLSAELVCDKLRSCGLRMQNLLSSFDRIHKTLKGRGGQKGEKCPAALFWSRVCC